MDIIKKKKNVQKSEKQKSDNKAASGSKNGLKSKRNWSDEDKKLLLETLKKYGSENIEALSKMLPNISLQDIQLKISEYSEIAKDLHEDELLNNWMECGLYQSEDSLIPEALLCVKLFEDHPSPSETEGYDFRAIYNFLYRSCLEQTSYFDLSQKDRDLLCFLLSKIEKKVWPKCKSDIWEYVGRVYNKRNIKRVYPGKNIHTL